MSLLHGGWGNELVTWWWGISVFYMVGGAMGLCYVVGGAMGGCYVV